MATLPIRQNLDVLAGLNRTQRAVLTLVVELAENGGKGHCDATNDYLCTRTQATPRTVTRALAELQRLGLIASAGHTTRRQLVATDLLRPCYASPTKEACFAATVALGEALSIDKMAIDAATLSIDIQGVSIDKQGQCLETIEALSIDIQGGPYKETSKNEKLDEKNEQDSLRSALALASKKNEEVASQLAEALEDLATCRTTIADLRAQLQAAHTGAAARVATSVQGALPYLSAEFAASWQDYRAAHGIAPNSARERALLKSLQGLAATEADALAIVNQSVRKGWKDLYKIETPTSHAASSHIQQRGAKPTAAGPIGARALAEHLAALDRQDREASGGSLRVVPNGQATGPYPH